MKMVISLKQNELSLKIINNIFKLNEKDSLINASLNNFLIVAPLKLVNRIYNFRLCEDKIVEMI